jgi:hypothetical protein
MRAAPAAEQTLVNGIGVRPRKIADRHAHRRLVSRAAAPSARRALQDATPAEFAFDRADGGGERLRGTAGWDVPGSRADANPQHSRSF